MIDLNTILTPGTTIDVAPGTHTPLPVQLTGTLTVTKINIADGIKQTITYTDNSVYYRDIFPARGVVGEWVCDSYGTIQDWKDLNLVPTQYSTRWPTFSEVTEKPSTIAGYGITDAYKRTGGEITGTVSIINGQNLNLTQSESTSTYNSINFFDKTGTLKSKIQYNGSSSTLDISSTLCAASMIVLDAQNTATNAVTRKDYVDGKLALKFDKTGGTVSGEITSTSANAYRLVQGNYGTFFRNDGSSLYLLCTTSGDQYGGWNTLRPFVVNLASGAVAFGNGLSGALTGSLTGNASTATALQTARTIALGGDFTGSNSFDGTGNITISGTLANSGVTAGTYRSVTVDAKGRVTAGTNPTTLAGYGITDAAKTQSSINFGGSATAITTADFVTQLTNLGAFSTMYWCTKAGWSYAGNNYITDTGVGTIQLAGCTVEVIGGSTSAYTIRIHTAPTVSVAGAVPNADFVYVNHGSGYSPKWHKIYNTDNKPSPADIGAASTTDLSTAIAGCVPIASRGDWVTQGVAGCTAGMMGWRNYGNGHVIFDASSAISPDGTTVDRTNPSVQWGATYPTLMGWNGANTYGVRVDSARNADYAANANLLDGNDSSAFALAGHTHGYMSDGGTYSTLNLNNWIRTNGATGWYSTTYGGGIYMEESNYVRIYGGKRFYVNNTDADAISTAGGIIASGRIVGVGAGNDYNTTALEVRGNGSSNVVFPGVGFHQPGVFAGSLQMRNSTDFLFYQQGAGAYADVYARSFVGGLSGNASTATKLASARTIIVGSTSALFDGSSSISFSLADMGAVPTSSASTAVAGNYSTVGTNTPSVGSIAQVVRYTATYTTAAELIYASTTAGSVLRVSTTNGSYASQACTGTWKMLSYMPAVSSSGSVTTQFGLAVRIA